MSIYAYAAFIIAGVCLYFGTRRRRNRRVGLPPPSHACKRNTVEAAPQ